MSAFTARLIPALVFVSIVPVTVGAQDDKADILPITTARIDQLMKGLAIEYAVWKPAYDRDQKKIQAAEGSGGSGSSDLESHMRAREKYSACESSFMNSDSAAMRMINTYQQKFLAMKPEERARMQARLGPIQERLDELESSGGANQVEMNALKDSVRQAMFEITGVSVAEQARTEMRIFTQLERKCGKEPPSFEAGSTSQPAVEGLETDTLISDAGMRATGLRPRAYTILRERVAAYLLSKTEDRELGDYVFTAAEKAALDQRIAALRKYAEMLAGTGHWQFD